MKESELFYDSFLRPNNQRSTLCDKPNLQHSLDSLLQPVAGGCFWCLEAVYDQMKGVVAVESGYMGGQVDHPTYEAVCSGRTGHAEAVRITFDPTVVSYRELLEVLFVIHDPTTLNRQGHDVGTQYRSAIFYHTPEQKQIAEEVIAAVTKEKLYIQIQS